MSDTILKIIPKSHTFEISKKEIELTINVLKKYTGQATIEQKKFELPEFIDCGTNLSSISCPFCNVGLSKEYWQDKMLASYEASHFVDLSVELPCCKKVSSLNDLIYNLDCGFAKNVIEIINPMHVLSQSELDEAGTIFDSQIAFAGYKLIVAHY